jgi:hypothetical protein
VDPSAVWPLIIAFAFLYGAVVEHIPGFAVAAVAAALIPIIVGPRLLRVLGVGAALAAFAYALIHPV